MTHASGKAQPVRQDDIILAWLASLLSASPPLLRHVAVAISIKTKGIAAAFFMTQCHEWVLFIFNMLSIFRIFLPDIWSGFVNCSERCTEKFFPDKTSGWNLVSALAREVL